MISVQTSHEQRGGDELVGQVEGAAEGRGGDEGDEHEAVGEPPSGGVVSASLQGPEDEGYGREGHEVPVPVAREELGPEGHVEEQGGDECLCREEQQVVGRSQPLPAEQSFGAGDEECEQEQQGEYQRGAGQCADFAGPFGQYHHALVGQYGSALAGDVVDDPCFAQHRCYVFGRQFRRERRMSVVGCADEGDEHELRPGAVACGIAEEVAVAAGQDVGCRAPFDVFALQHLGHRPDGVGHAVGVEQVEVAVGTGHHFLVEPSPQFLAFVEREVEAVFAQLASLASGVVDVLLCRYSHVFCLGLACHAGHESPDVGVALEGEHKVQSVWRALHVEGGMAKNRPDGWQRRTDDQAGGDEVVAFGVDRVGLLLLGLEPRQAGGQQHQNHCYGLASFHPIL